MLKVCRARLRPVLLGRERAIALGCASRDPL